MACSKIAYSLLVPETQRDRETKRERERMNPCVWFTPST